MSGAIVRHEAAPIEPARPPAPFRDSLLSTLGSGVGVAIIAGVPTLIVCGVVVYAGWSVWKGIRAWKASRQARRAPAIDVRELPSMSTASVRGAPAKRRRRSRVTS